MNVFWHPVLLGAMLSLAVLVWGLLVWHAGRVLSERRAKIRFAGVTAAVLLGWLGLAIALGVAGAFGTTGETVFPAIGLGIAVPLLGGRWLLRRSEQLKMVVDAIPLHWLVGIQFYRTIGLVFLVVWALGLLPGVFAWPAGAGDAAVGTAAPIAAYLLYRSRQPADVAALAWNVAGIADLAIAVLLGFLSTPSRFQILALDRPSTLITTYPLVLIAVFGVPLSILLHWVALRRLRDRIRTGNRGKFGSGRAWPGRAPAIR